MPIQALPANPDIEWLKKTAVGLGPILPPPGFAELFEARGGT